MVGGIDGLETLTIDMISVLKEDVTKHVVLCGAIIGICILPSLVTAASLQSKISAFDAEDCAPVVEDYLDRHSVDLSKITTIDYITQFLQGSGVGNEKEFEAWVSFSSCKGNLAIIMDMGCHITRAYPTYTCDSQGLPTR